MSRYFNWTTAYEGIANYIKINGIKTNPGNFKVEDKIFNIYCKANKINGSFSERVLQVTNDFLSFKNYIKNLSQKQS